MIVFQKHTPVGSRRIVAELVGPSVNWLQKLQLPCSEADCKFASSCRQRFEYRPSRHPVKRHRELPQLLDKFAQAPYRRKTRGKLCTVIQLRVLGSGLDTAFVDKPVGDYAM
jgi:hypothetical protein